MRWGSKAASGTLALFVTACAVGGQRPPPRPPPRVAARLPSPPPPEVPRSPPLEATSECVPELALDPSLPALSGVVDAGADRHAGALLALVQEVFEGLRAGAVPERLGSRRSAAWYEEEALSRWLGAAPETRPCPRRVVALRYPGNGRHRAILGIELADREGPLGVAEIEARRHADGWRVELGRLAQDLDERVRLRAAQALLRAVDAPIRSSGDVDLLRVTLGAAADRTHCVRWADESGATATTRCFAGPWGDAALQSHLHFDSRHLCLRAVRARGDERTWLVRWPDGPIFRGRCDTESTRPLGGSEGVRRVPPPHDLAPLAGVRVRSLDHGVRLLSTRSLTRVCLGRASAFACAAVRSRDAEPEGVVSVDLRDPRVALEGDEGWLAIRRHRDEGGAEAAAGDETLALFRVEPGRLSLHGYLPLGGYTAERIRHDGTRPTVWRTADVHHERVALDARGCVTIGPQRAVERVTERRLPRPRVESETPLTPRTPLGALHDGLDRESLDDTPAWDAAGHWRPRPDGGFRRVPSCAPAPPR